MTTKLMTLAAALALGSSLFADPCKCGKPECKCGDECRCTAETCKCGCGTDKDVLAEEEDDAFVSAEFGLAFDSKYLTYGVVDGKDPILTPGATVTFFDTFYFGVEAIFDVTKGNGKRGGYGNRAFKYTTLDGIVGVTRDFDLGAQALPDRAHPRLRERRAHRGPSHRPVLEPPRKAKAARGIELPRRKRGGLSRLNNHKAA